MPINTPWALLAGAEAVEGKARCVHPQQFNRFAFASGNMWRRYQSFLAKFSGEVFWATGNAFNNPHPVQEEVLGKTMQLLSIQNFAAAANQSFGLTVGEAEMAMTLVEVKPLPVHAAPGMLRAPFSLMFRSETQIVLPQRLYTLRHAQMGKLDIFLVPVARDSQGILYQAVFN